MLGSLGKAYESLGEYAKQRDYSERALRIQESHKRLEHPEVAITLTNLGNAHGNLGDYAKKRDYLARALRLEESHY
eukprot:3878723-Amphidinium_carterae.1